ncbi:transposase [Paraphaeosphaeria minitans]|uniref:Transposase n=1 Tax=Paraphaeosphaeria minitans TaxID=565426 RepID=A0A9P6G5Q3_9PLEO|nr:transposase [Paraphaeosphaeria minitans]KAF9728681.1 transposase [Paraphaeosphaeria minitans]
MNETGIRIGVAKDSFVYTRRGREVLIPTATNRELISLVECVSATGVSLPPMLIMKAKTILEQWAVDLPSDYLINITDSGYANDQTAIDWIKHFDRMTAAATPPETWRLLLIDGHGSHLTAELANFCESHYIQLYALPPHTTHLLQPLDVGCFQPLKWYHSRTLDWASRTGAVDIRRSDFLATLAQIRGQAFKENTIKSGWRKAGLAPFCPEQVIAPLRAAEAARNLNEAVEEAEDVLRYLTPEVNNSSGEEEEEEEEYSSIPVLRGLSPGTQDRFFRQIWDARGSLREELAQAFATPRPHLAPGDIGWSTPKTVRVLNLQEKAVAYSLRCMLPYGVAEDVISTLKGSSVMARTATGLEQALNRTKAAEHASTKRRRRNHRVVNAGGGPIYAKDCREMAIQRIANEAAQQQAAVNARARRALVTRFNT